MYPLRLLPIGLLITSIAVNGFQCTYLCPLDRIASALPSKNNAISYAARRRSVSLLDILERSDRDELWCHPVKR